LLTYRFAAKLRRFKPMLDADLTILAKLSGAFARARTVPVAASSREPPVPQRLA
jgi:hypothetical protein